MQDAISSQLLVVMGYMEQGYTVGPKESFKDAKFLMSALNRCVRAMEIVVYQKNFLVPSEKQAEQADFLPSESKTA